MAVLVVSAGLLAGCSRDSAPSSASQCPGGEESTLTVLSASSMVQLFEAIEPDFVADNPCVADVVFSFGSSATLAAQVANGAPADVFVSASQKTMEMAISSGRVIGDAVVFARNEASIMVSATSPVSATIAGLADLGDRADREVRVGLCVESAPCGALADQVLERAGSTRAAIADTEAASVEDLVTKVELGELDAGIVYRSDCAAVRATVRCVGVPAEVNATTDYLVAILNDSESAHHWLRYMTSQTVRGTLTDTFGFLAP